MAEFLEDLINSSWDWAEPAPT